ncbi:amino acid adenylation domain-containing protein [Kitasatospora sp. NPDC054939]
MKRLALVPDRSQDADVARTLTSRLVDRFRLSPELRAVSDDREFVTYRDLDRRSAALAGRLVALGVGPDRVVALHCERSVDLAVAIVGVIRAGGAWLPLATGDPDLRIRDLLRDASPVAVLTDDPVRLRGLAGGLPCLTPRDGYGTGYGYRTGAGNGTITDIGGTVAGTSAGPIDAAAPGDLAYVIYTSGSTGLPKGVLTEHAAIVNRLDWMQERFRIGPGDVVAQKTPYTFDVSVWEFLWPLMTGAELAFAAPDGHRDPGYLADFLAERAVTVTHFVPSMLREFLRYLPPGACPRLRTVAVSGEALAPDLVQRFFERLPHAELHNLYGPTEAAVDVTHWHCRPDDPAGAPVPIGRPITGIELLAIGAGGAQLPPGEVGELCIAGAGVARGYLGRPELTAERFVPHPADPARRMYRTGDLASLRPDGAWLYHGRNDRQVKIGGVRIELGEVEAAFATLPYVEECVVLTRTDASGTVGLHAVIVPGPAAPPADWRADLRRTLPAGSVPAGLTTVDAIPRTAHGKADVAALRSLVEAAAEPVPAPDGPAAADLEPVARLWVETLGTAAPHFLAAGGTSLHAIRLLAGVADRLGVRIPLADFLAEPTLDRLRALIAAGGADAPRTPVRVPRDGPLRPNRYQERLWFLQELEPHSTAMSAPTALRVTGADRARVEGALARLLERHEVLRTTFATVEGEPVALVGPPPGPPVWELREGLDEAGRTEAARRAVEELAHEPFDLAAGAPLRIRGIGFDGHDHLLLAVAHQIVADGWTWSLLAEELVQLLTGERTGPGTTGPETGTRSAADTGTGADEERLQVVDHAAWQRAEESGPAHRAAVEASLVHWRTVLAQAPDGLELPSDGPRGASLSAPAGSVDLPWSPGFPDRLRALCRERRVTEFTALLAGYTGWLARISGQETVVVGTPMAHRTPEWTAELAGYFVTTVPQCLEVDEDATFDALLERARTSVLDGQRHSVVPIERIVAEVGGRRGADRLPIFQNLFVFQNMPAWRREADGVAVQVLQYPPRHTHYDLKFEVFPLSTAYEARLVHARGRISAERAALMARQLAAFVEAAVDAPGAYLDELPL